MSRTFGMAPIIRIPLITLYGALVLPLPLMAPPGLRAIMVAAAALGLVLVLAITSERVLVDDAGITVGHPRWCAWLLRRGWRLDWSAIEALTPVRTSQGGSVFYVRRCGGEAGQGFAPQAFLLPQRLAEFEVFLTEFGLRSGLDTRAIGRVTPPWTYRLLAVLSGALLASELGAWALVRP